MFSNNDKNNKNGIGLHYLFLRLDVSPSAAFYILKNYIKILVRLCRKGYAQFSAGALKMHQI